MIPYISFGLQRDSNLFLRPNDEESDLWYRGEVGVNADLSIGQQNVVALANFNATRFDESDVLDHQGGAAHVTWNWQVGDAWSGKLGYKYDRFLTSFREFRVEEKDLTTKHNGFFEAGYNVSPSLRIRPILRYLSLKHSRSDREDSDENQKHAGLAVLLRTRPGTFVGVEGLFIDGDYPNRDFTPESVIDDGYEQKRASLVVEWEFLGKSQLNTQVGYTRREQDNLSNRDVGEPTWRIELEWQTTGKTALNFAVWRDIVSVDNRFSSFSVDDLFEIGSIWKPTTKLVLGAKATYRRRDFKQNLGTVMGISDSPEDDDYLLSLDVSYALLRKVKITVGSEAGNRDSNIAERDYRYWNINSELRVEF